VHSVPRRTLHTNDARDGLVDIMNLLCGFRTFNSVAIGGSFVPVRRILLASMVAVAFSGFGIAADSSPARIIEDIGDEIEKLKTTFPQLEEFSRNNVDVDRLTISYSYRTHEPARSGGWTSGVPNPDADGVWFHVDLHDAQSAAEIHTQPITTPICLGNLKVSFLLLEGTATKTVYAAIWKILARQGVKKCVRA
jgi:hypothetical protein